MKITANFDSDTISFKGMSTNQFAVLRTLLHNTRLGTGDAGDAAYEILMAIEEASDLLEDLWIPTGSLYATSENRRKVLEDPTLEVTLDDE